MESLVESILEVDEHEEIMSEDDQINSVLYAAPHTTSRSYRHAGTGDSEGRIATTLKF